MALEQLKFKELGEEEPSEEQESLAGVKALAAKLRLQTRRASYLQWEQRVRGQRWGAPSAGGADRSPGHPEEKRDGGVCGFGTVEEALEWLRTELRALHSLDQLLAQQLLRLRAGLQRLRVEQACHRHRELLDAAAFGLEGCEEDSELPCTIPARAAFLLCSPLRHIGLTRMNIHSRRFSLC